MGNDGGSIPGRQDLVKSKKRRRYSDTEELVKKSKSKYCSLSKEPLKKPIVGDKLGQIYNKAAIVKGLLEKNIPESFEHITSLKDVKDLNVEISDKGNVQCPVTMIEFSGINKFFFLWKCGCVMSKNAIDEIGMKDKCIVCGEYCNKEQDLISLNYTKEEKEKIKQEIMKEKTIQKMNKIKKHSIIKTTINDNSQRVISKKRERDNQEKDDEINLGRVIKRQKI